jgi:metal-responsive CopG/Arc/MetJ family transcriptional regulator
LRLNKCERKNDLLNRFDRACQIYYNDRSQAIRQLMYKYIECTEEKHNVSPSLENLNIKTIKINNQFIQLKTLIILHQPQVSIL